MMPQFLTGSNITSDNKRVLFKYNKNLFAVCISLLSRNWLAVM